MTDIATTDTAATGTETTTGPGTAGAPGPAPLGACGTRPAVPAVHALLTDGSTVRIRAVRPEDRPRLERLYEEMSAENLRLRFFVASRRSARQAAAKVCDPAATGCLALVAEAGGRLVGVAQYDTVPAPAGAPAPTGAATARPRTADLALAVADDRHRLGIGTLLVEHLVAAARQAGIRTLTADALADNHAVLRVFAELGLRVTRRLDHTEVHCTVDLTGGDEQREAYLSAVDARARTADVASLQPLLRPRSVAVVGAGRRPGSVGRAVLEKLISAGWRPGTPTPGGPGTVQVVNPHAAWVAGVPCHPSVAALPAVPDLAVLAVPAHLVPATAEQCGTAGVRALVVLTAGLDRTARAELLAVCRRHGMRLVGPNCLGIVNTERAVHLDATFAADRPARGTAGVAVQSGGVGIALLDGLSRLGIGVSTFVSLGDKCDVSGNDMLQWWESDETTDLAVLHVESFGNPRAFSRTARRVARTMPVLTVDAGRSAEGRRAAASHTAAAATPTMTRQALFTQAGIIATRSIGELLDTAALLHSQPLPAGASVAIVSNAGGIGVLAADACVEAGLTVPALGEELTAELLAGLPDGAAAGNPVDTTAAVTADRLRDCVRRIVDSGAVDAVIVALAPTALAAATGDDPLRALTDDAPGDGRPVLAVLVGQEPSVRLLPAADGARLPAYADPQAAARALAHAARYAAWRAEPRGTVPPLPEVRTGRARDLVRTFLDGRPEGGWLEPRQCAELLDCYGIPQVPWAWAEDDASAAAAARRLAGPGGRVALKGHAPGVLHKSDHGAVLLDLTGEAEAAAGYRELAARLPGMTGALVQPMARPGTELFAGVVQDEVFGPLVLFGLGGTATEILADHAARLAPLTDADVRALLGAPRCAPLLHGFRGSPPVDLAALARLLHGLSRMATDLPQLAEADLNPVVARADGVLALDVRIRLVPRQASDPYVRRLR